MGKKLASVRETVDALTRPRVMKACRVRTQVVTNWIERDRFPPQRYPAIKKLCDEDGIEPPDHLFFGEAA